jgi:hypothetical protein
MASWGSNVGRGSALRLRLLDFWRANQRVLLLLKKMQQQQLENILSTENLLKYSKTLQFLGNPYR